MDPSMMAAMQYQDISTGAAKEGTMNMGGLYKRHMNESILNFILVKDIDKVLAKVKRLGGKIVMPKEEIKGVELTAVIQDSEGTAIGF
jgi:predicted enzyme related to lactoylglutathione lyase